MEKLSGKIYWTSVDFLFTGHYSPSINELPHIHAVTNIENAVIDDNMIRFSTIGYDFKAEKFSYIINLIVEGDGLHYQGNFTDIEDRDFNGKVTCELFQNVKSYFLYGRWYEDEAVYTWWAKIDKYKK